MILSLIFMLYLINIYIFVKTTINYKDMTIGKQIETALIREGRKKKWLCEKLDILQPSLCRKLKQSNFTPAERFYINSLLGLDLELKS